MHHLQAIIASDETSRAIVNAWEAAGRRQLAAGLWIVPLTTELTREITGTRWHPGDLEASVDSIEGNLAPIARALAGVLRSDAAIVLTEYFGGAGAQVAALIVRESNPEARAWQMFAGDEAINRALAALGVQRGERDEFNVAGLDRWHSTDDVLDDAG